MYVILNLSMGDTVFTIFVVEHSFGGEAAVRRHPRHMKVVRSVPVYRARRAVWS